MRTPPSSKTVTSAPATSHRFGRSLPGGCSLLGVTVGGGLRAHRGFVGALLRLILLALGHGPDVGERRPVRHHLLPSRRSCAEVLDHHADHDPRLGGAESRQRCEPLLQVVRVLGLRPDPGGVAAVLVGDDLAEPVDALRHAHREAVERRRRLKGLLDLGRVHSRDLDWVDRPEPLAHVQRTLEGPFDGYLLIEAEADQQRGGILADELVRRGVASPLELQGGWGALCHACTVARRASKQRLAAATAYTRRMSWLGRLFGSKPPAAPLNSVVVASDLVQPLTAGGAELSTAVDGALRTYLDAQAKALAAGEPERIPFWLRRDAEHAGDLEDELRDRVIQRRAAEDEAH